jgi:putative membrane protein
MYGSNYGYGHHMFGFGSFWMIILWIVIIVGAVIVIKVLLDRDGRGSRQVSPRDDSALDILKKRYAAGEIDHDEFERRKKNILGT